MATSKTLAPTNVTISIPAMTDAPNASVLANCADKEADAINALNSQINGYTTMASSTDLNTLTTNANYMVGNMGQMTNAPSGCGTSGFFYVVKNSTYVKQEFFGNLGSAHRFSYDSGSTWTAWATGVETEVTTGSSIASGASATIAYPTGFTMANTRVVYCYLYISSSLDRYPSAAEVTNLSSDGIHVKNNGGAGGIVCVGIVVR